MFDFHSGLPNWFSILFLLAITIPVCLIAWLARTGIAERSKGNRVFGGIIGFYLIYFHYVAFATHQGWFEGSGLPAFIIRYTSIPLLIFLLGVMATRPTVKDIVRDIPLFRMVRIHIFRLIGSIFLVFYVIGELPASLAIPAGVGDVSIALSGLVLSFMLQKERTGVRKLTWIWNVLGLLDILMTAFLANYVLFQPTPTALIEGSLPDLLVTEVPKVDILIEWPFSLIPAFAPPTIIFLHGLIFMKLKMEK